MNRRGFLASTGLGAAGLLAGAEKRPPNLLFIHTDQQHFETIRALGCEWISTPNLDRLSRSGTSFDLSYSANPVCCPARSCWYTGRTSSETRVVENARPIRADLPDSGQWFRANGYETVYAGKWHIPGRKVEESFRVLTGGFGLGEHGDGAVSRAAQGFLTSYSGDKPFFLSLGFLQPHDICYWIMERGEMLNRLGREDLPPIPESLSEADLPPLPPNFQYDQREPETFVAQMRGKFRTNLRERWTERDWRYYRWAYYRHVEMVDAEIGRVLDALDSSGRVRDTLVVFSADHGEGMGMHQTVLKHFLYDEAARVPLMISWPEWLAQNRRDRVHLASGLDVLPTLCDFAGIPAPPKARGRSLRPLLEDRNPEWREFVVSESATTGRMIRTAEHKLITYQGDQTQQLFDMKADPRETKNLAFSASHAGLVANLRKELAAWESRLEVA